MQRTTTVIIGAGQSGLAMSHALANRGVEHVILERGQIANSWRTERWDSLRLLSPNRLNGLPGHGYEGPDPDGFMEVADLIQRFDVCAALNGAPIEGNTTVLSVTGQPGSYFVQTNQSMIACESVVMANGTCGVPKVPTFASQLPASVSQFTPLNYKRPQQLPDGKVLVVGASASGLQLARELQQSGRQVILAVGNHLRFPRRYRGVDISSWLDMLGLTSIPHTDVDDLNRVRRTPSLTLIADETIDLNTLQDSGVEIAGRVADIADGRVWFSGSLANHCAGADLKMNRLLASIDGWVDERGLQDAVLPPGRLARVRVPDAPRLKLDLAAEGVGSVLWATGYRPDFSWLDLPVFDRKGSLRHDGGVVADGLYVMGLPYLRQRKSTFINGASDDARALSTQLISCLNTKAAA